MRNKNGAKRSSAKPTGAKRSSKKPMSFNGMFRDVQMLLKIVKALISIILWVLNAILFSAAFRHIPFGCESCACSGQTKVQRPLNRDQLAGRAQRPRNRSEAELDEVNVPER